MFKRAAGTILKLAAIGVISVPLEPAVSVNIATISGLTPKGCMISGASTPVAITGKAANEFPITMVNKAIPRQLAKTSKNKLSPP